MVHYICSYILWWLLIILRYIKSVIQWLLIQLSGSSFVFGSNYIYEERTALRYTDVFINCSVDPIDAHTSWDFENIPIFDLNNNHKYHQNNSGLTIYNVTEQDQGHYICFLGNIDPLNATILLDVVCKLTDTKHHAMFVYIIQSWLRATTIVYATKQNSGGHCWWRSGTKL